MARRAKTPAPTAARRRTGGRWRAGKATTHGQYRLREYLEEHGGTVQPLATLLGCHPSMVWGWAAGRRKPSVDYAVALEEVTDDWVGVRDWARPEEDNQ